MKMRFGPQYGVGPCCSVCRAGEKCGVASGGVSLGGRRRLSVGARAENQLTCLLAAPQPLGITGASIVDIVVPETTWCFHSKPADQDSSSGCFCRAIHFFVEE